MIPAVVLFAATIALSVERTWAASCALVAADLGTKDNWPEGYCVEATISLRDELNEQLPEVGAELIWGSFTINTSGPKHAWIELASGYILDITLSQFFRGRAPILIRPDGPLGERFVVDERSPSWADPSRPEEVWAVGSRP